MPSSLLCRRPLNSVDDKDYLWLTVTFTHISLHYLSIKVITQVIVHMLFFLFLFIDSIAWFFPVSLVSSLIRSVLSTTKLTLAESVSLYRKHVRSAFYSFSFTQTSATDWISLKHPWHDIWEVFSQGNDWRKQKNLPLIHHEIKRCLFYSMLETVAIKRSLKWQRNNEISLKNDEEHRHMGRDHECQLLMRLSEWILNPFRHQREYPYELSSLSVLPALHGIFQGCSCELRMNSLEPKWETNCCISYLHSIPSILFFFS